jgi:hydrogenase/urease accessory protein HupE
MKGWIFMVIAVCAWLIGLGPGPVAAHEVRPAYLELRQTGAETYDVLWKVPARGEDMRLSLDVRLPGSCANLSEPRGSFAANSFTQRWSFCCPSGLAGETIRIDGLSATVTDVLVRLERADGTSQVTRLRPDAPSFVVEAVPARAEIVRTFLPLGIEHILTGVDHLLFILGLLLLVNGGWRLVKTVTAFTVAHSVTLTLATLGYVHVPQPPVEAVIALSIVFVAREVLRSRQRQTALASHDHPESAPLNLAERQPWLVAFSFGLLHGLGFASGLSEAGLPQGHIPLALLLFSIGVEIGHFSFIGLVLAVIALGRRAMRWKSVDWLSRTAPMLRPVPAYTIGTVSMFWLIERISAFR